MPRWAWWVLGIAIATPFVLILIGAAFFALPLFNPTY